MDSRGSWQMVAPQAPARPAPSCPFLARFATVAGSPGSDRRRADRSISRAISGIEPTPRRDERESPDHLRRLVVELTDEGDDGLSQEMSRKIGTLELVELLPL